MWCFLKVRLSKTWTPLPALTPYPFNGNRIQGNAAGLPPEVCELELSMLHQSWDQTNSVSSFPCTPATSNKETMRVAKKTCPLNLVQVGTQEVKSRPDFRCGASCVRPCQLGLESPSSAQKGQHCDLSKSMAGSGNAEGCEQSEVLTATRSQAASHGISHLPELAW